MRLFIGLPLPAEYRLTLDRHLAPWRQRHRQLKWVDAKLYHFTLQFLGDVEPTILPALIEALKGVKGHSDFSLETGGALALPPGPRARVLALGLQSGLAALRDLARSVQEATATVGFPPEERAFKAHLTLARVRRGEKLDLDPAEIGRPELPPFPARAFHLYESELRREGPVYTSRAEQWLGQG